MPVSVAVGHGYGKLPVLIQADGLAGPRGIVAEGDYLGQHLDVILVLEQIRDDAGIQLRAHELELDAVAVFRNGIGQGPVVILRDLSDGQRRVFHAVDVFHGQNPGRDQIPQAVRISRERAERRDPGVGYAGGLGIVLPALGRLLQQGQPDASGGRAAAQSPLLRQGQLDHGCLRDGDGR